MLNNTEICINGQWPAVELLARVATLAATKPHGADRRAYTLRTRFCCQVARIKGRRQLDGAVLLYVGEPTRERLIFTIDDQALCRRLETVTSSTGTDRRNRGWIPIIATAVGARIISCAQSPHGC
jgi:hypothetical protein